MEEISQTERYRSGVYRDEVLRAVRHRGEIDAVLARHRTKKAEPEPGADAHAAQEAEAMAESVANEDDDAATEVGWFPFRPYCRDCGRDTTTVTAYDDETTDLAYVCSVCDYHGTTNLATQDEGKLVWKVDWPMRWAFEHVDFEPAGMDHATPGSSFTVGHELVESIWEMPRPAWFGYGFVGFAGVQKMSSSAGGAPTASDALRVLEPAILRWLYVRRQPQADLRHRLRARGGPAVRRVGRPGPEGRRRSATSRCSPTSARRRPSPPVRCPPRRSSCRSGCSPRWPT